MDQNQRWEITCSQKKYLSLKSDDRFLAILTLSRAVNALRFCQVAMLGPKEADTPSASRQRINGFLFSSSVLYEGLLAVDQIRKHLRNYTSFKSSFQPLLGSEQVRSFRTGYLKTLRNKLVFHFDKEVPNGPQGTDDSTVVKFATAIGDTAGELYFDLADRIALDYLVEPEEGESGTDIFERHKPRMLESRDLMIQFADAAQKVIAAALLEMGWEGKVCE